jgi:hypothetical protein
VVLPVLASSLVLTTGVLGLLLGVTEGVLTGVVLAGWVVFGVVLEG